MKRMLSKIKNFYRLLIPYNPLHGLISNADYVRLIRLKRFENGKVLFLGKSIEFSDNLGFCHSVKEIFIERVYQFHSLDPEPLIVDCGSNIGLSILYFKNEFPDAKILGFEPDSMIYQMLVNNIKAFGLKNVVLENSAVWTQNTELNFFSEGSLAGSVMVDFADRKILQKVRARRLKDFLHTKVDFLKIDIEGSENELLFDLEPELLNVKNLFLEYHGISGERQKLGDILNLVTRNGFRYYIRNANDFNTTPFIHEIKKGFDLQLNIFCTKG